MRAGLLMAVRLVNGQLQLPSATRAPPPVQQATPLRLLNWAAAPWPSWCPSVLPASVVTSMVRPRVCRPAREAGFGGQQLLDCLALCFRFDESKHQQALAERACAAPHACCVLCAL